MKITGHATRLSLFLLMLGCSLLPLQAEFDPVGYAVPGSASGRLFVADLDSDGRKDLITSGGVSWRRNLGVTDLRNLPFAPSAIVSSSYTYLNIVDMDGDGDLDYLGCLGVPNAINQIVWKKNLLVENGSLSFESGSRLIYSAFTDLRGLFHADLDNDGDQDIISCDDFGDEKYYFHRNRLNEASANFAAPVQIIGTGSYNSERTLAFADVDGDGDLDAATRLYYSEGGRTSHIVWMENRFVPAGTVTFVRHKIYAARLPSEEGLATRDYTPNMFYFADMDGDGDQDLFTSYNGVSGYYSTSGWYENFLVPSGTATFSALKVVNARDLYYHNHEGIGQRLDDVDGNGRPDFVYRNDLEAAKVIYNAPAGAGVFAEWAETVLRRKNASHGSVPDIEDFALMDLDGDGDKDLLTRYGNYLRLSENLHVGARKNQFSRYEVPLHTQLPYSESFSNLQFGDAENDGDIDFYLDGTYAQRFIRNDSSSAPNFAYTVLETLPGGASSNPVTTATAAFDTWRAGLAWTRIDTVYEKREADIDLDEDQDLVVLHRPSADIGGISWFRNTLDEDGGFQGPFGISSNTAGECRIICCDYDGDGDQDVVSYVQESGAYASSLVVFRNQALSHQADDFFHGDRAYSDLSRDDSRLSCKLELDGDLDWSNSEKITIPARHLSNQAAMQHFMRWRESGVDTRFYRITYSINWDSATP